MVSLTIVGCLVSYDNPALLNGSGSADANASPFVIAIRDAGIAGVPSLMNVVIMIAVLSVGNSSIYASSRTLAALSALGQGPKIFGYIDRSGRPLVAILFASVLGVLSYLVAAGADVREKAFTWMLAISGLSSIFTWGSICLCHIRFRQAMKVQGRSLNSLAYRSQPGVYGSWVGFIFNILVLIAQFWTGFAPVGYAEMTSSKRVENFFQSYLSAPIIIVTFIIYKFVFKTRFIRASEIDLVTGQRELNLEAILAEERAEQAQWPIWKKVYKWFC